MASRLTPIGWIAKFLIAPAALGALGFYVIGPRIGAVRPAPHLPIPIPTPLSGQDAKAGPSPEVQDSPPAGVDVSVKPSSGGAPNLGQDSDADSSSSGAPDDNPKPRVRPGHRPPSMVAPPTDPQDNDGSGGQ